MVQFLDRSPRAKFIPVEDVLDVNDPNRWWFYIPGFNGYEISNDGYIRSMKHFMKYPYGILIKKKKDHGTDPSYELSDNNNERKVIRLSQIQYLAKTNPYAVSGYPRRTNISDIASRNQRCFVKNSIQTVPVDKDNMLYYPKFTVIDEEDETKTKLREDVIVPIRSVDNSVYYGREDIRTIFN